MLFFTLGSRKNYDDLMLLFGEEIIYKDGQGDVFSGILQKILAESGTGFDVSITIIETERGDGFA